MGWFSVYRALVHGVKGGVKEALRGEIDPARTLVVALDAVDAEIRAGRYCPDKRAKARLAYWRRVACAVAPTAGERSETKREGPAERSEPWRGA
jgi:hypothetical protein